MFLPALNNIIKSAVSQNVNFSVIEIQELFLPWPFLTCGNPAIIIHMALILLR